MLLGMQEGIITAIVTFFFVCILFPKLVKNHAQFYVVFALILLIILLQTLGIMFASEGFLRFVHVMVGLMTIGAMLLLVLATGGLSVKDLGGEFLSAFEVIRRGESEKEVIVPLTGEMPKPRKPRVEPETGPGTLPIASAATEKKADDGSSIPLE
jgi:hypothetical protein